MHRRGAKGASRSRGTAARTEKEQRNKNSLGLVEAANAIEDLLTLLPPFREFKRNGVVANLKCYRGNELPPDVFQWMFELLKNNMKAMYDKCPEWGWKEREKKEELLSASARHIVVFREDGKPLGFIHLRFMYEDSILELYLWEVQLEKEGRCKGIGKHLLQLVEILAYKLKFPKVTLTVFKDNEMAQNFFRKKMKFQTDATDPTLCDPFYGQYGYDILSKQMPIKIKK